MACKRTCAHHYADMLGITVSISQPAMLVARGYARDYYCSTVAAPAKQRSLCTSVREAVLDCEPQMGADLGMVGLKGMQKVVMHCPDMLL